MIFSNKVTLGNPLFEPCREGDLTQLNALLADEAMGDHAANINLLLTVARLGHDEVLNRLLTLPRVQDVIAADDNIVLDEAILYGRFDIVIQLLRCKSVEENLSKLNDSTFHIASIKGFSKVVFLLLKYEDVKKILGFKEYDEPEHIMTFLGFEDNYSIPLTKAARI
jgi:hypothetical protein